MVKKICFVATIPAVVHAFLREHIQAAAHTYEVTVVCNSVDKHWLDGLNARLVLLPIERKPSPWGDASILAQLYRLFRTERFDIVHSHFPKTGLLGMLAAWLAGVPVRVNTFHGEVWATRSGWRRVALRRLDRLVSQLATEVLVVSPSQRDFLVSEGVMSAGRAKVIGAGSICGVDAQRFLPRPDVRVALRSQLGIAQTAKLILFVGRLNIDKGMLDLAKAFNIIAEKYPHTVLLLVGAEEDVPYSQIQEICSKVRDQLHYLSFTATPELFMAAADVFCLPSYREGFGMTIVESAACGVPSVAARIYGITDAVADGETGLLFPAGNIDALAQSLIRLITDDALRRQLGRAARARTLELFASAKITRSMLSFYGNLLDMPVARQLLAAGRRDDRLDLSISVVSHAQIELVANLVGDLQRYCNGLHFELILTLNTHEELTFSTTSYSFPIKLVRNTRVKGFGANHNQAFRLASGRYFCVINPDIRLHDNPFGVLLHSLDDSAVGVVAPLLFGTNAAIENSARSFPSPLKILWKAMTTHDRPEYSVTDTPVNPDWVGGMFMLFPYEVFERVHGFDERYFLYYEDVDICGRLRLINYEVVLCPQARVTHHAQRRSHSNVTYMRWHLRSMMRFFFSSVYWRLSFYRKQ